MVKMADKEKIERLTTLIAKQTELCKSYMAAGDKEKAKEHFRIMRKLESDLAALQAKQPAQVFEESKDDAVP